jgi:hypothetical protein
MRKLLPIIAAVVTALVIASFAIAQPGIGITKTAPLAGTGSSGNPLKITPCANGEVYQSNGTTWSCVTAGDVTAVTAGAGMTGGGTTGALTLNAIAGVGVTVNADEITIDPTYTQRRVSGTCAAGTSIRVIDQAGTVTCETDDSGGGASVVSQIGPMAAGQYNNWSPTSLATSDVIAVQAFDDEGTLVTGIDAIGAAFAVGHRIAVCNTNAPQDDGVVAFSAEDASSTANNRIWTPGYGRNQAQTATDRYTLAPSMCIDLIYLTPDSTDLTIKRWIIVDNTRLAQAAVKQLSIFPYSIPATITGTVNDWDPVDVCAHMGGAANGSCEAGANVASTSYTMIMASTLDTTGAVLTGLKYTSSANADGHGPVKILRNLGPGPLTLMNVDSGSAALNRFYLRDTGDSRANIVIPSGESVILFHIRDSGSWVQLGHNDYLFDGRDLNMTAGGYVGGTNAAQVVPTAFFVDNTTTGRTGTNWFTEYIRSAGSHNTTASTINSYGMSISNTDTRSAGGNSLTNYGLLLSASGAQANIAIASTDGNVYFGLGNQMSTFYVNAVGTHFSGTVSSQGTLTIGSSDFGTTGTASIKDATTAPTLSSCGATPSVTGGSNWFRITVGTGVTTACTATFAGTKGNTPVCLARIEHVSEDVYISAISATAITITAKTGTTDLDSNVIDVFCGGDS